METTSAAFLQPATLSAGKCASLYFKTPTCFLFVFPSANQWAAPGKRWRTMWIRRGIRLSDSSPTLFTSSLSERSTLTDSVTPARSLSLSGHRVSGMVEVLLHNINKVGVWSQSHTFQVLLITLVSSNTVNLPFVSPLSLSAAWKTQTSWNTIADIEYEKEYNMI